MDIILSNLKIFYKSCKMIKYLVSDKPSLTDKLVIVSGVSIGGIPTYAIDLLIMANRFKRIGFLRSEHLEPSVGYLHKNI